MTEAELLGYLSDTLKEKPNFNIYFNHRTQEFEIMDSYINVSGKTITGVIEAYKFVRDDIRKRLAEGRRS